MSVKNTVIVKLEEAFSFLKDNRLNLTITKESDINTMHMHNKINIAVIEQPYTGLDLILLLSRHPKVNIKNLCATKI